MCYKVHTHTLPCDVRPTISSGRTHYLDPYETPPPCPCPRSSSRPKNCPSHGCCRLSSTLYLCPRDCSRPLNYHIYTRSSQRSYSSDSSRRRSYSADPRSSYRPPTPPRWRTLRIFDRDPDFQTRETGDLRFAISELRDIGRVLLHAETELEKAELRIDRERNEHCGAHGGCENLKPTKDCEWSKKVAEMVNRADDEKFTIEVLADCWVKYVGLLRKYEAMGQRRVGGLVEDPLSGRRRRGDDETRGYGRRESWDGAA
ncbi:hypothetical protein CSOJ01_15051 [Colletotrichum sojae]|uniref:Uncharacterized protein n=1 Tax=Colletotrichum sojae TaxID=2175907 RepID=A0A8H6INY1_9PEZI|nr:hypothetical protein CSOJ01_15051 [Colletotrichum sojae]